MIQPRNILPTVVWLAEVESWSNYDLLDDETDKIPENSPCEQWPRNRCFYDKRLEVSHFMQEVRWWSYSQSVHSKNCFTDYHNKVTRTRNQAQKRQIIHFYIMPLICCLVEFVLNLSCWWVKTYPLVLKWLRGNTIHLTMCSCPRIPLEYIWCRN